MLCANCTVNFTAMIPVNKVAVVLDVSSDGLFLYWKYKK